MKSKKSKKEAPKAEVALFSAVENLEVSKVDYKTYPWPYEDGTVKSAVILGVLEFVPGKERGKFMDELHRILTVGGKATLIVPYWASSLGIQDYAYEWPPMNEVSFMYFNKGWRDANTKDRNLKCDFDFTYGYAEHPEIAARNAETKTFAIKNYINAVNALQIVLVKR